MLYIDYSYRASNTTVPAPLGYCALYRCRSRLLILHYRCWSTMCCWSSYLSSLVCVASCSWSRVCSSMLRLRLLSGRYHMHVTCVDRRNINLYLGNNTTNTNFEDFFLEFSRFFHPSYVELSTLGEGRKTHFPCITHHPCTPFLHSACLNPDAFWVGDLVQGPGAFWG